MKRRRGKEPAPWRNEIRDRERKKDDRTAPYSSFIPPLSSFGPQSPEPVSMRSPGEPASE